MHVECIVEVRCTKLESDHVELLLHDIVAKARAKECVLLDRALLPDRTKLLDDRINIISGMER